MNPRVNQKSSVPPLYRVTTPNSQQPTQQKSRVVSAKTTPTQLLKSNILSNNQKNNIHNLISFLSALSTHKYSKLIQTSRGVKQNGAPPNKNTSKTPISTDLFRLSNSSAPLFTKEEIIFFITQTSLCVEGKEEELMNSLIEICTPEQVNYLEDDSAIDFTSSAKQLLHEINIEERPEILNKIAQLLESVKQNPQVVSDELKKRLLDILKDSDDKDEIEELKFDYANTPETFSA